MTFAFSTTRRKERKASSGSSISSRKQRSILLTVMTGRMRSPRACGQVVGGRGKGQGRGVGGCNGSSGMPKQQRDAQPAAGCPTSSSSPVNRSTAGTAAALARPSPPPQRTWRSTVSVCTHTPSMQSTTTRAPSVMRRAAVTSEEKSTWPAGRQ
jgi:hypothetical protein